MNSADLANMLELMAQALRMMPAGAHQQHEWPSLHEIRSLSARLYRAEGIDVQTLLGHKDPEMTSIYLDDRGLSAGAWRRVSPTPAMGDA